MVLFVGEGQGTVLDKAHIDVDPIEALAVFRRVGEAVVPDKDFLHQAIDPLAVLIKDVDTEMVEKPTGNERREVEPPDIAVVVPLEKLVLGQGIAVTETVDLCPIVALVDKDVTLRSEHAEIGVLRAGEELARAGEDFGRRHAGYGPEGNRPMTVILSGTVSGAPDLKI